MRLSRLIQILETKMETLGDVTCEDAGFRLEECSTCDGSGMVYFYDLGGGESGPYPEPRECYLCYGTGVAPN